jgi:hypothetical protein
MWASATFFNMKLIEKVTGLKDTEKSDTEIFQFILDNTFDDNNITGDIAYHSRDELLKVSYYTIKFSMVDGKLTELDFSWPEDGQPMGSITYLSKEARDFGFIDRYLKTKKILGIEDLNSWENLEKLGEWFKLYDVFAIESSIPKFEKANDIIKIAASMSPDIVEEMGLKSIEFDKETGELNYYDLNDVKRNIKTLGAGSQSMLMMIVSATPMN